MVTPVDPSQTLARLAALMREAVGRQRVGGRAAGPPVKKRPPHEAKVGARDRNVAALLAQRIRGIGPDHPQRRLAVSRLLVESLLTEEFGEATLNDAAFQAIVDDVLAAMRRSAGVAADLDRIVDALIAMNPSSPGQS
jgi:hypothetical protein